MQNIVGEYKDAFYTITAINNCWCSYNTNYVSDIDLSVLEILTSHSLCSFVGFIIIQIWWGQQNTELAAIEEAFCYS